MATPPCTTSWGPSASSVRKPRSSWTGRNKGSPCCESPLLWPGLLTRPPPPTCRRVVAGSPDPATAADRRSPGFSKEETFGRGGGPVRRPDHNEGRWSGPETGPQRARVPCGSREARGREEIHKAAGEV